MKPLRNTLALRVALFYGLFGGIWILVSDRVLKTLVDDPEILTRIQTYKGWLFVLASALLIYLLLFFELQKRKQAEDRILKHLIELEAINKISTALRTSRSMGEMLPSLLDETLCVLEAQAGSIWLYNLEDGALHLAAARGVFAEIAEDRMQPDEGLAGAVYSTGVTVLSPQFSDDPRARPSLREQIPAGWGGACIPIRTSQEVVGVLFVAVESPRQLTSQEARLLSILAEIAGSAIHRMNLFDQTERHLQRISALHAIDLAIGASLDLGFILDIFLGQVIHQLNVDAAAVLLLNPVRQRLEYAAYHGFQKSTLTGLHVPLGQGMAGKAALERTRVEIRDWKMETSDCGSESPVSGQTQPPGLQSLFSIFHSEGFNAYFGVPLISKGNVKGVLEIFHRLPLYPDGEWLDFQETLAGQAAIAIDNASLFEGLQRSNLQLSQAYDTTLKGWSRALELRDQETQGHTERVARLVEKVSRVLGINDEEIVNVRRGTLLHDIGKMGIPDRILLKRGSLTEEEWAQMRRHPLLAYELLAPIEYLRPALDIPYCHHERWDGSGYPRGLKGEEIPLAARIFALVDVWDALCNNRPYRQAWSKEKIIEYFRWQAGRQFDPRLTPLFLDIITQIDGRHRE